MRNCGDTPAVSNVRGARCVGNVTLRRRSQLTAFALLILLIQGYGNDHAVGEHAVAVVVDVVARESLSLTQQFVHR